MNLDVGCMNVEGEKSRSRLGVGVTCSLSSMWRPDTELSGLDGIHTF
jgi:hypothetical protein